MRRRESLKIIGGTAAGLMFQPNLFSQERAAGKSKPNILFVMTDDQRADATSIGGNKVLRTPNIDRIGHEGVNFRNAFVTNALCAPSRASILTGAYSHLHGVTTNGEGPTTYGQPGLSHKTPTFVELLREAGYFTGITGKWHLQSLPVGFDHWVILPGQGEYFDPQMIANGARVKMRGHVDDAVGDQALAFLATRPKDKPFCLLMQFKSPHRSWEPAPRFAKMFDKIEIPTPRTYEDKLEGRPEALKRAEMAIADMPDFRDRGVPSNLPFEERKRRNLQALVKNYYRVLLSVDENVGRVLDYMDKEGLAKNSVVIYTSDNGFFLGEHGLFDKRLMYEQSIRVPMLMRYPEAVKPNAVDSHMVLNIDVAPTLLDIAEVQQAPTMQGQSWMPVVQRQTPKWREDFLYEYYEYPAVHCVRKHRGVRTERWKLIHYWEQPQEWELYDLQNDPDEIRNLASDPKSLEVAGDLKDRLNRLRTEFRDSDPPGPPPVAQLCKDQL